MAARTYDIRIRRQTRRVRVPLARLRKQTGAMLRALGWNKAALSIVLVDDRKIRAMNRRYLGRDRATDVIAFSQREGPGPRPEPNGVPFLGDLAISLETAKRQARAYGNSLTYELAFYVCHGILHLMGRDDKTKRQAARMERIQKRILKEIKIH